jgi:hypothetical protein
MTINAPLELVELLRTCAVATQRQTVVAVVVEAIDAALSGGLSIAGAPCAGTQLL